MVAQTVNSLSAMQETWVGKIPWRRKWQPIAVFLPGKSQRSLADCSPWCCKELDTTMTEHTHLSYVYTIYYYTLSRVNSNKYFVMQNFCPSLLTYRK